MWGADPNCGENFIFTSTNFWVGVSKPTNEDRTPQPAGNTGQLYETEMPYNAVHGDHATGTSSSFGAKSPSEGYVPISKIQQSILEAMHLSYQKSSQQQQSKPAKHARPKKYSRPCDGCAFKKVRCSGAVPCTRCVQNKVECTNVRIRKKCGPKPKDVKLKQLRTTSESSFSSNSSSSNPSSMPQSHSGSHSNLHQQSHRHSLSSDTATAIPRGSATEQATTEYSPTPDSPPNLPSASAYTATQAPSASIKYNSTYRNPTEPPQRIADLNYYGTNHTSETGSHVKPRGAGNHANLSLDDQLPTLHVFQTWYYGVWPVVSVPDLISKLDNIYFDQPMSYEISVNYALALAICAAISRQVSFLSPKNAQIVSWNNKIDPSVFANECLRIIHIYNHRIKPSTETLLASFFLYVYYINDKDGVSAAIIYLREALAIAQLMKLHEPKTYENKSNTESHRLSKIYYLLLITERYTNIQEGIPVVLDALIPLPSLYDEEYPSLLSGFTELAKIFLAPSRQFFDRMSCNKSPEELTSDIILRDIFGDGFSDESNNWIVEIQNRLSLVKVLHPTSSIQAANIILSKYWMMSLVWHASHNSGMISTSGDDSNCLSVAHPHKIAHDFLASISELPVFAFESNGPGVVVKLLEIANGLADSAAEVVHFKAPITFPVSSIYDSIQTVFGMVSKFKSNFTLPDGLCQKIENILNSRPIIRNPTVQPPTRGYITEIKDGDDGDIIEEDILQPAQGQKGDSPRLSSELKPSVSRENFLSLMDIVSRSNSSEYLQELFQPTFNSEIVSPNEGASYGFFFNGDGPGSNGNNVGGGADYSVIPEEA